MVLSHEPVMTRPSGTAATQRTQVPCPATVTTSLENRRALIALRAATLTTLHVGAARPMWCAVVMRTTMCPTTSAGRSEKLRGSMPTRCASDARHSARNSLCELKKSRISPRERALRL